MGIIDIHGHIWMNHIHEDVAAMVSASQKYGIEKILISPLGTHRPNKEEIRLLNREANCVCKANPLFARYVTVAPEHDNALSILETGVIDGAVGMKMWVSCLADDNVCDPLYEYCAQLDIPVLVHTFAKSVGQLSFESTAVNLANAAKRHVNTKFVMAHLGGNCYHGIPVVSTLKNVYLDFSGSNCRADDLMYTLDYVPIDRILFGTDMPGSFIMTYGQVLGAGLTEEQVARICRENALTLFSRL